MSNRFEMPFSVEKKIFPTEFPVLIIRYTQEYRSQALLHSHNCLEIGCCVSGNGLMFIDGTIYSFLGGSVSIIPKGVIHDARIIMSSPDATPSVWKYIFVDVESLGIDMEGQRAFVVVQHNLRWLFDLIFTACEEALPHWQEEAIYLLKALAIAAGRVKSLSMKKMDSPYRDQILMIQHKISLEYDTNLSVESLARACNLSVSCFRNHFTHILGISPQQYIIHVRLSIAEHFLRNTDDKIIEIAQKVGFRTLSSFNRLFLKNYGYPPSALRG